MYFATRFVRHVLSFSLLKTKFDIHILTSARNYSKISKRILQLLDNMPKKTDLKGLQDIRIKHQQKVRRYPSQKIFLQVLGSGAQGAPTSLYVFTDRSRYLFNCGEGTQRVGHEHKVKMNMLEDIFITHKSWRNVGGIPGMLLTLQANGVPEVNIHGPPGVESLCYDTQNFIRLDDMKIGYEHYQKNAAFTSNRKDPLTIQSVPLWAKEELTGDPSGGTDPVNENQQKVLDSYANQFYCLGTKSKMPKVIDEKLKESTKCRNLAIAYICQTPPKAGQLKLELCVRAGVPPGPLLGQLKSGKDVTLPNGKVVLATDVTGPDHPSIVFIVVEAPTTAYLDSLLKCPAFSKYQGLGCEGVITEVIVHFTPSHIINDPRYQEWMARFSPSTSHLYLNSDSVCMGSTAVHRVQYKLNLLSKHIFPLLKDDSIPIEELKDSESCKDNVENSSDIGENSSSRTEKEDSLSGNNTDSGNSVHSTCITGPVYQASTLMIYHIRPRRKIDRSNHLKLTPAKYIEECYETENFESLLADTQANFKVLENNLEAAAGSDIYPNIVFLGTGSSVPSKTRNTSAILVSLSASKCILMDCAEGTYWQLIRLLGKSGSDEVLRCLVAVYVSHLHADHHLGFIRLLMARKHAFKASGIENVPKLLLLAPGKIAGYLSSYHLNFESIYDDFTLISNHDIMSKKSENKYEDLCNQLDMKAIDLTFVIHCRSSYGVAWTHKDGWKLAYSGDTMPCKPFVEIGRNCDLLIHEATMEDGLESDAKDKYHSTISQAIKIGRDMNARHILLTHFSQRYAKLPFLQSDVPENVGIAFDNMKVWLKNFPTIHHMYKTLLAIFSEEVDIMKEKSKKRKNRFEHMKTHLEFLESQKFKMGGPGKKMKQDDQL